MANSVTSNIITPPPPCFSVGNTHSLTIRSFSLHITKTWIQKSGLAGAKPRFPLVCFLVFHDPSSLLCVTSLPLCFLSHISVIKAWVMQSPPNSLCGGVFATWTLRGNNLGSTWSAIDCRVQSYCESRASSMCARWGCFTAPGVFWVFLHCRKQ